MAKRMLLCLILASIIPLVVDGAASIALCEGSCVESFEESCPELVSYNDFLGDCCALTDSDDGGCTLSVAKDTCSMSRRGEETCEVGFDSDGSFMGVMCVGNSLIGYQTANSTEEECFPSDYNLFNSSLWFTDLATITFTGISSLAYQDAMQWRQLSAEHMLSYFDNNPELGVNDLMTYFLPFIQENATIVSEEGGVLPLDYYQQLTWRSDSAVDGQLLIEDTFFGGGREAYLELLQSIDAFADVTNVSYSKQPVETLAPTGTETEEEDLSLEVDGNPGESSNESDSEETDGDSSKEQDADGVPDTELGNVIASAGPSFLCLRGMVVTMMASFFVVPAFVLTMH